jgi:hypothetical protein
VMSGNHGTVSGLERETEEGSFVGGNQGTDS